MIKKYENFNQVRFGTGDKKLDLDYIEECFVELLEDDENYMEIEDKFQCSIVIYFTIADFGTEDGADEILDKLGESYTNSSNIFNSISNSIKKVNLLYKYSIEIDISYSSEIISQIEVITIEINYK